jgi:hypothetical protein
VEEGVYECLNFRRDVLFVVIHETTWFDQIGCPDLILGEGGEAAEETSLVCDCGRLGVGGPLWPGVEPKT